METQAVDNKSENIVKKSPLEEKVKKYLDEVSPEIQGKIHEKLERVVNADGEKNNVLFVRFSDSPEDEEVNDEVNVSVIKDILFHYHTAPEKIKGGKALVLEIVPPADGQPHTICFYEVS